MTNDGSRQPTIRVEHADDERAAAGRSRPVALSYIDEADEADEQQPEVSSSSTTITTNTTTEVYTTTSTEAARGRSPAQVGPEQQRQQQQSRAASEQLTSVAVVEDLGKQAALDSSSSVARQQQRSRQSDHQSSQPRERSKPPPPPAAASTATATTTTVATDATEQQQRESPQQLPSTQPSQEQPTKSNDTTPTLHGGPLDERVPGNKLVTTISTIGAQSGQSRIVLALLKDGDSLQLKVQEMRPTIFEVGANHAECLKYLEEHQKLVSNLSRQRQTPIDGWMDKYAQVSRSEPTMSTQRKLVYLCMVENLQGCWRALLNQLGQRSKLLEQAARFYRSAEQVSRVLDRADEHIQVFRSEFLAGPSSDKFGAACDELGRLNARVRAQHAAASREQERLLDLIAAVGTHNLADSRANLLIADAQALMNYVGTYLDPLERRRLELVSVTTTTTNTETTYRKHQQQLRQQQRQQQQQRLLQPPAPAPPSANGDQQQRRRSARATAATTTNIYTDSQSSAANNDDDNSDNSPQFNKSSVVRHISNFSDLDLARDWLQAKIEQLNSSLLSSLGASGADTRTILNKHEQIALECRAIEEATLHFNGRNIHAIKALEPGSSDGRGQQQQADERPLFEQQKLLAQRVRDVISVLEARIVLLRRTIDFYVRSKEATSDIGRMMRRLQVDNSLQAVQFVSNELELKDVSSVVASGATVISELQQLQLAQQHGQRSRLVSLKLHTSGIRAIIDQLSQDLAHLKTVLNQRRLVLLNEDAAKMASNFSNKCRQLHFWLVSHVKSFLLANSRVELDSAAARAYCESHEQLRQAVQTKTPEVEALLRSLPILNENFDAKNRSADELQRSTDELREDWISTTNCLDRRIELARKFVAILNTCSVLTKELSLLENLLGVAGVLVDGPAGAGRPTTPIDERSDSEIRANCDQLLNQLAHQVKSFECDCRRANTELVYTPTIDGRPVLNDINKQLLVDHAHSLLDEFGTKRRAFDDADAPGRVRQRRFAKTVTTGGSGSGSSNMGPDVSNQPAHQRPQLVDPPRFTRTLAPELTAEPFRTVELECETDQPCQVDWFLGSSFKRIPQTVKHQASSENNQHKLTISQFSPICCGQYVARATNSAGQATSQCRLRLAGIVEADDAGSVGSAGQQEQPQCEPAVGGGGKKAIAGEETTRTTTTTTTARMSPQQQQQQALADQSQSNFQNASASPAEVFSTTSSFSQWRPTGARQQQPAGHSKQDANNNDLNSNSIARIIRGVSEQGSSEPADSTTPSSRRRRLPTPPPQYRPAQHTVRITQVTSEGAREDAKGALASPSSPNTLPVSQTTTNTSTSLSGAPSPSQSSSRNSNLLKVSGSSTTTANNNNAHNAYYTESPVSWTSFSRSASRSPMDGTPRPPVFVQSLADSMPHSCSRAGLVCLVVGNPPPTIEWLHNNQTIATTKCPRASTPGGAGCPRRGNICKLTIETVNHKTHGQYVCRASNRLGQSSTQITIDK